MIGCPSTAAAVQISSDKLNCSPPQVYHCLTDQNGRLTQKCIKPSWIQTGHCAEYNTIAQRLDSKACAATLGLCPQKPYLSNDVISFSGCAPSDPKISITTVTSSNQMELESGGTDVLLVIIPIIISIVIICISVGVAVYLLKRKRQQRKDERDEENDVPLMDNQDHGNGSVVKGKEEHLKKAESSLEYFEYKGTYPTYSLKTTLGHLMNYNNVVIVGKPGSGKTTLAWTVCKQMHGESSNGKKWHVTVSADTDDIPDDNNIILLLLDDRFESEWTTEVTVEKILKEVNDFRKKSSTKQVLIMVTISQHAYRRIEKYDCIQTLKPWHIIDLDDEKNCMNIVEISKVFDTYNIFFQNVRDVKQIFPSIPQLGFPLIAKLIALNWKCFGSCDFIKEPIKRVLGSTKELRESGKKDDNNKYCTIVYAAFNGGYVDKNDVNKDMMQKIGDHHKIEQPEIDTNSYLLRKRTDRVYEFVHRSLLQVFLAAYGKQYLGFVVKHCRLDVLLDHSVSDRETIPVTEKPFYLIIGGTEYERTLATRIIHEKVDIRNHRIWKQTRFQETYKKLYVNYDEMKNPS